MGMVTMYTIGVVVMRYNYRYPHNNYYFFLLHLYYLFFGQLHTYFFVHLKIIIFSFFKNKNRKPK